MLPREHRITRTKDIDGFFGRSFKKNGGRSASSKVLVAKVLPRKEGVSRFGFVVNLKVDKRASARNKVKRRLREIIQNHLSEIKPGNDVLLIALTQSKELDFDKLEGETLDLLKKLRLLQ